MRRKTSSIVNFQELSKVEKPSFSTLRNPLP
jgi:hypothetical protein